MATSQEIITTITDTIIAELEAGTAPWVQPWSAGMSAPYNPASKHRYNGINYLYLSLIQSAGKLGRSNHWVTYNQAKSLGGYVKKGAKGAQVVFYKPLKVEDKATGEDKTIPLLKSYTVFNADMIEGVEFTKPAEFNPIEECESFVRETKAKIHHGYEGACFIPSQDEIHMPKPEAFRSQPDYYATLFHELTHWSGAESRLNRIKAAKFGSEDYAFEELVAELGASMLCSNFEISAQLQHASYIASWLKALKNDRKYILKASAQAQKAFDYLTNNTGADSHED